MCVCACVSVCVCVSDGDYGDKECWRHVAELQTSDHVRANSHPLNLTFSSLSFLFFFPSSLFLLFRLSSVLGHGPSHAASCWGDTPSTCSHCPSLSSYVSFTFYSFENLFLCLAFFWSSGFFLSVCHLHCCFNFWSLLDFHLNLFGEAASQMLHIKLLKC